MLIDLLRLGLQKMRRTLLQRELVIAQAAQNVKRLEETARLARRQNSLWLENTLLMLKLRGDQSSNLEAMEAMTAQFDKITEVNAGLGKKTMYLSLKNAQLKSLVKSRDRRFLRAIAKILTTSIAPSKSEAKKAVDHMFYRTFALLNKKGDTGAIISSIRSFWYSQNCVKRVRDFVMPCVIVADNADNLTNPLAGHTLPMKLRVTRLSPPSADQTFDPLDPMRLGLSCRHKMIEYDYNPIP